MSSERDEVAITFDMVENYRFPPEFAHEEQELRRTATKMLVSKRGISMPAVREDLADRAYRFQNKLGTKTLLNAVCTWDAAVTYQARILHMVENAIDEHNTSRVTQRERLRCPSPEDTVDNNPVEEGVLSSCSSLSSVAGERDEKEKRGQGDDKHEDKENRKDEANEERVENGKEEGEEKEKYERRHGEEEEGGAEGAEIGEDWGGPEDWRAQGGGREGRTRVSHRKLGKGIRSGDGAREGHCRRYRHHSCVSLCGI